MSPSRVGGTSAGPTMFVGRPWVTGAADITARDSPEGTEGVAVEGPAAVRGGRSGRVPAGGYPLGGGRSRAVSPSSASPVGPRPSM